MQLLLSPCCPCCMGTDSELGFRDRLAEAWRIVCQGRHGKINANLGLRQRLGCHWRGLDSVSLSADIGKPERCTSKMLSLNRTCKRRGRRSCRCGRLRCRRRCGWLRGGCRCSWLLGLGLWSLHRSLCSLGLRWGWGRNWRGRS